MSGLQIAKRVAWVVAFGVGFGLALAAMADRSVPAGKEAKRPPVLKSKIVRWTEASPIKGDWGEMRTYYKGETSGTRDVFAAVAVVEPGKAVHRAHRHVEEEYLIINEGSGVWHLDGKESPARKGDMLYVEPWVFHGLTNTGDKPLVFTVIKFNSKGIELPSRPDSGKDER